MGDVDNVANKIVFVIMETASCSITHKNVTIGRNDSPWMHNEIR